MNGVDTCETCKGRMVIESTDKFGWVHYIYCPTCNANGVKTNKLNRLAEQQLKENGVVNNDLGKRD